MEEERGKDGEKSTSQDTEKEKPLKLLASRSAHNVRGGEWQLRRSVASWAVEAQPRQ